VVIVSVSHVSVWPIPLPHVIWWVPG